MRGDRWRLVSRRGGFAGLADQLRAWLARSAARGLTGERRGIVEGVVLGGDAGLSDGLRRDFRASGLYHLLAVSGQNVALVAGSALLVAWLLGLPRLVGELGALAAMAAYVLAVGAQPSVVRAAVAGALGSLTWLAARQKDRWHFLLLRAIPLLTVPANALAAPAVVPLLGLGLAAAAVAPLSGSAAATLAGLNGWCAAYLAGCARLVGGLPFAQIRSGRAAAALVAGLLLAAAYA